MAKSAHKMTTTTISEELVNTIAAGKKITDTRSALDQFTLIAKDVHSALNARFRASATVMYLASKRDLNDKEYALLAHDWLKKEGTGEVKPSTLKQFTSRFKTLGKVASADHCDIPMMLRASEQYHKEWKHDRFVTRDVALNRICTIVVAAMKDKEIGARAVTSEYEPSLRKEVTEKVNAPQASRATGVPPLTRMSRAVDALTAAKEDVPNREVKALITAALSKINEIVGKITALNAAQKKASK